MPGLLNPFSSFGTGSTPNDITEPWGEVARQDTVSGGKLTISGLDLSGMRVVRLYLDGITVTTDDSQVFLRFMVGGSEVSTGYRWSIGRTTVSLDDIVGSNSGTEIPLSSLSTRGVGNASTEGLGAVIAIFDPGATTTYKRCHGQSAYTKPDGTLMELGVIGGQLDNTGALTGVVVYASSNLTGGTVIMLGVE